MDRGGAKPPAAARMRCVVVGRSSLRKGSNGGARSAKRLDTSGVGRKSSWSRTAASHFTRSGPAGGLRRPESKNARTGQSSTAYHHTEASVPWTAKLLQQQGSGIAMEGSQYLCSHALVLSKYLVEEFEKEPAFIEQVQRLCGGIARPVMAHEECYAGEQGQGQSNLGSGTTCLPMRKLDDTRKLFNHGEHVALVQQQLERGRQLALHVVASQGRF